MQMDRLLHAISRRRIALREGDALDRSKYRHQQIGFEVSIFNYSIARLANYQIARLWEVADATAWTRFSWLLA